MIWPPPRKVLRGEIVALEPIAEAHREPLRVAADDPRIFEWMDRRIPDTDGAFDEWFNCRLEESAAARDWCFVTISASADAPIGSSSYLTVRPSHDGLEIGWTWLNPSAWRTGANSEAKLLMLAFAFEELGCMRVEFKTDARNERSRNALAALPATFEGIFRKHMLMPGIGVRDSAYFAITDDDWPDVRRNLEERLAQKAGAAASA